MTPGQGYRGITLAVVDFEACDIQHPIQVFDTYSSTSGAVDLVNYMESLPDQVSPYLRNEREPSCTLLLSITDFNYKTNIYKTIRLITIFYKTNFNIMLKCSEKSHLI